MCCLFAVLLFFGPRIAFLIYWFNPAGHQRVSQAFTTWLWPLLGLIFVPWVTLVYVLVFPIHGLDWLWLGLALLADFGGYSSGASQSRGRAR